MKLEFKECKECLLQPGSPPLCASCLHNREIILQLQSQIRKLTEIYSEYASHLPLCEINKGKGRCSCGFIDAFPKL